MVCNMTTFPKLRFKKKFNSKLKFSHSLNVLLSWLGRYCNTRSGWCYWPRIHTFPLLLYWKHTLCSFISGGYDTYYHYTDLISASRILLSKKILPSQNMHGDAVMGEGAYLTKFDPSYSRSLAAKNNYGYSLGESKLQDGSTNVCFEMKLPKYRVRDGLVQLKRNIHLHREIINLSEVKGLKVYFFTSDTKPCFLYFFFFCTLKQHFW